MKTQQTEILMDWVKRVVDKPRIRDFSRRWREDDRSLRISGHGSRRLKFPSATIVRTPAFRSPAKISVGGGDFQRSCVRPAQPYVRLVEWCCSPMDVWLCGRVVLWTCGPLAVWTLCTCNRVALWLVAV